MMSTYTTPDILRKYEGFAPRYDERERLNELTWAGTMRRELMPRAAGRVLEVAVGTGANFAYYPRTCQITAVDLSSAMLDIAAERARQLGLPVTLRVMNAEALDFPDHSFDTVISSLSTCTFEHPLTALREMARVCRPDGHILLMEHGRSSSPVIAWLQERMAARHGRTLACQWTREPVDLVRQAGLTLIADRRRFFGVLHTIIAAPAR